MCILINNMHIPMFKWVISVPICSYLQISPGLYPRAVKDQVCVETLGPIQRTKKKFFWNKKFFEQKMEQILTQWQKIGTLMEKSWNLQKKIKRNPNLVVCKKIGTNYNFFLKNWKKLQFCYQKWNKPGLHQKKLEQTNF